MNAHEKIARRQQAQLVEQQRRTAALLSVKAGDARLFEQIGADDYRCIVCLTTTLTNPDLIEGDDFESFGGTTEGYERCAACKTTHSYCDLSAVI